VSDVSGRHPRGLRSRQRTPSRRCRRRRGAPSRSTRSPSSFPMAR
jgi:hypothetical protein